MARGIAEIILGACREQGRRETYTIKSAQAEAISAAALDVAEHLCVDRAENALRELVRLKDIKERIERAAATVAEREDYRINKERAWADARSLL